MLTNDVEGIICQVPGLTATQIARTLYGDDGYHERVGAACRELCRLGRTERRGHGGPGDRYTYYCKNCEWIAKKGAPSIST
jgi:hypothetical protein